jgi:hypothetical protein
MVDLNIVMDYEENDLGTTEAISHQRLCYEVVRLELCDQIGHFCETR